MLAHDVLRKFTCDCLVKHVLTSLHVACNPSSPSMYRRCTFSHGTPAQSCQELHLLAGQAATAAVRTLEPYSTVNSGSIPAVDWDSSNFCQPTTAAVRVVSIPCRQQHLARLVMHKTSSSPMGGHLSSTSAASSVVFLQVAAATGLLQTAGGHLSSLQYLCHGCLQEAAA
jgi:hypothetical protein